MSATTMAPPPVTLRPLAATDAPALQRVYSACADYFLYATGQTLDAGQAAQDLAEMASDDARHILGIFLNEELVGVIDFRFADPEPFDTRLGLILVADSYRRQGLGTWALRILAEWLRQATPSEALVLTVQAQDLAAQRFFRHAGFAFTGRAFRAETAAGSPRFLFMRQDLAI